MPFKGMPWKQALLTQKQMGNWKITRPFKVSGSITMPGSIREEEYLLRIFKIGFVKKRR
jgi:hypothetical protein